MRAGRNRAGVGGISCARTRARAKVSWTQTFLRVSLDVSRELLPGSGGSCLERPAECFVAPNTLPTKPQAPGVPILPHSPASVPLEYGHEPGTYVYAQDAAGVVRVVPQAAGAFQQF